MTGQAIDTRLVRDARPATIYELANRWRMLDITVRLPGMAAFSAAHDLGNKLRGALGSVLLKSASKAVAHRLPCNWGYTSTAEVFFGRRPMVCLGGHSSEISKPFVFAWKSDRSGALVIRLRIFGFACERAAAVADALIVAIKEKVAWREMAKEIASRAPDAIEPTVDIPEKRIGLTPIPSIPRQAELCFQTPVDADRGDALANPRILLHRIVRRTALLAPWHGLSIEKCYEDIVAMAELVPIDGCEVTSVCAPDFGGHRHGNALSPPLIVRLSDFDSSIWQGLRIGEVAHIGRGASLGLGRYRIGYP